jgi:vacuolar-type H+-ATPase subunit D/Vma8
MNLDKVILVGRLRKTQKHVNALQNIFIPAYEETAVFIVSYLEEGEETFRLKMLQTKIAKSAGRMLLYQTNFSQIQNLS